MRSVAITRELRSVSLDANINTCRVYISKKFVFNSLQWQGIGNVPSASCALLCDCTSHAVTRSTAGAYRDDDLIFVPQSRSTASVRQTVHFAIFLIESFCYKIHTYSVPRARFRDRIVQRLRGNA